MNIAFQTRILIAASVVFASLATSISHAQTTTVNGVTCAANAVSLTYGPGGLIIQTGGCGVTPATPAPVPTSPPSISSVSPTSGAPGNTVTISGTNLGGATVLIGGVQASAGNNSGTQIITTVPIGAAISTTSSPGNIVVTTSVAPHATIGFTVAAPPPAAAPTISSVSPASGSVNTVVTITGTGLTGATVTIGGVAAIVTTSSSTSITTTVPATAPVAAGSVAVTTAVAPAASFAFTVTETATTTGCDVSVEGFPLPCLSKELGKIPQHAGASGAGPEIMAYSMPVSRCKTTPALTKSWQHNIDRTQYINNGSNEVFVMNANESLSYRFATLDSSETGGFSYGDSAQSGGQLAAVFVTITEKPCDFDLNKVSGPNRDACYQTGSYLSILWTTNEQYKGNAYFCQLEKGKKYYMNLRFQDARPASEGGPQPPVDSCVGRPCGGILSVR